MDHADTCAQVGPFPQQTADRAGSMTTGVLTVRSSLPYRRLEQEDTTMRLQKKTYIEAAIALALILLVAIFAARFFG